MYNPAHILAMEIAKVTDKMLKAEILTKAKWTKSQTFLPRKQHKNNIKGSIKFNTKYNIVSKKIVLVDDVVTTAVTINECAKILQQAGGGVGKSLKCFYDITLLQGDMVVCIEKHTRCHPLA
ncbi:ComF family protein [Candidatus Rickettsia barbariae]